MNYIIKIHPSNHLSSLLTSYLSHYLFNDNLSHIIKHKLENIKYIKNIQIYIYYDSYYYYYLIILNNSISYYGKCHVKEFKINISFS